MLAHRCDPAIARALAARSRNVDFEPRGRVVFAHQRKRRPDRRIGVDPQIAGGRQDARDLGRVAVIEIIAQPEDFRTAREVRSGNGLRRARPVGLIGLRLERARFAFGFAGVKQRHERFGDARRQHDGDGAPGIGGVGQRFRDRRIAVAPHLRRRPVIVDEQDKRSARDAFRGASDGRFRECDDDDRGCDQAEQQKPPWRARRRLLRCFQTKQQTERREDHAPRRRRRYAQQPPDDGQRRQRGQQPRNAETQSGEEAHAICPVARLAFGPAISMKSEMRAVSGRLSVRWMRHVQPRRRASSATASRCARKRF